MNEFKFMLIFHGKTFAHTPDFDIYCTDIGPICESDM